MTWRVAYSLDTLLAEINAAAPRRNKASDGSIGDAAHASRTSDHNPWVKRGGVGIVRARDFTHDPTGGLDCQVLADHLAAMLRAGRHPALGSGAYIIWRRRILSRDRASEGWRTYTGSNPHDHHLHLSVALAASDYDSRQPWGWGDEDDMAQYADQLDRIERKIDAARERDKRRQQVLVKRLRAIASEVRDDATKDQIKRVRADIAALADDLAADEATEDA